ncbi:hypothetical protein ES703_49770 [subsurface metagenome]
MRIKSLFRPKKKRRTGGVSSKTRVVGYRCSIEDSEKLQRRADAWNGGNVSEYVDHIMHRDLNRDHHKKKK